MNLSQFPERIRNAFNHNQILLGPHRIFPGRLSVSRSFGDIEAKSCRLGGIPGVLIAVPEIHSFKIDDNIDYIMLGCR
jgi:protein phosphatase 2C family protein 2/3